MQTLQHTTSQQGLIKHTEHKVQHSVKHRLQHLVSLQRETEDKPFALSEEPANLGRHWHYSSHRALTSADDTSWRAAIMPQGRNPPPPLPRESSFSEDSRDISKCQDGELIWVQRQMEWKESDSGRHVMMRLAKCLFLCKWYKDWCQIRSRHFFWWRIKPAACSWNERPWKGVMERDFSDFDLNS